MYNCTYFNVMKLKLLQLFILLFAPHSLQNMNSLIAQCQILRLEKVLPNSQTGESFALNWPAVYFHL